MSKKEEGTMPMVGFRYPKKKKEYLIKFYGKTLSELLREQADVLIVRSLKMENK